MTRPRLCRCLKFRPKIYCYKPQGVPMAELKEITISKEEIEAIKLKDFDRLDQIEAAEKMNTSQSTFQRILFSARNKIAEAIVKGKALRIDKREA